MKKTLLFLFFSFLLSDQANAHEATDNLLSTAHLMAHGWFIVPVFVLVLWFLRSKFGKR